MVTLEKEGDGRWMVRKNGNRLGVVLGGHGNYQAQRGNGELVGNAESRERAALLLDRNHNTEIA